MTVFQKAFTLAHFAFPQGGTCLEFGVGWGSTFSWQANQIRSTHVGSKLVGFDSWKGLPKETDGVWAPDRHAEGKLAYPKEKTESLIPLGDSRFRLVDGFFSESLTEEEQKKVSDLIFVNIDVDIHSSTLEVLRFITPLLRPGVILYWDDWKDPNDAHQEDWGEHRAFVEWYSSQKNIVIETLEVNTVNQRSMIVTKVDSEQIAHDRLVSIRFQGLQI